MSFPAVSGVWTWKCTRLGARKLDGHHDCVPLLGVSEGFMLASRTSAIVLLSLSRREIRICKQQIRKDRRRAVDDGKLEEGSDW